MQCFASYPTLETILDPQRLQQMQDNFQRMRLISKSLSRIIWVPYIWEFVLIWVPKVREFVLIWVPKVKVREFVQIWVPKVPEFFQIWVPKVRKTTLHGS